MVPQMLRELIRDALSGGMEMVADDVDDLRAAIEKHRPDCVITCDDRVGVAEAVQDVLRSRQRPHFVVLTGDARQGWVNELVAQVTPLHTVTADELLRAVTAGEDGT